MRESHPSVITMAVLCLVSGICVLALPVKGAKKAYKTHSRYWIPYEADPDTLGLFHLDRDTPATEEGIEEEMDLGTGLEDESTPGAGGLVEFDNQGGQGKVAQNQARDASLYGRHAQVKGDYGWSDNGRLGGCLELTGEGGFVRSVPYEELRNGQASTVEAWIRPGRNSPGTILAYGARGGGTAVELRRLEGGDMAVFCGGKRVGENTGNLPVGRWHHVALRMAPRRTVSVQFVRKKRPPEAWLVVDGKLALHLKEGPLQRAITSLSGSVIIANSPGGGNPFIGKVDEIRVSAGLRKFYPFTATWTDPEAKRNIADEQPYFREADDLLFFAPFDGDIEARHARGDGTGTWKTAGPLPDGERAPEPVFKDGVRGKAVLVGTGLSMPAFTGHENVNLEQGSFELWFTPYDWDNRKEQGLRKPMEYVPLLRVRDDDQKAHGGVLNFGMLRLKRHNKPAAPLLRPGRWYHVVGTWDGQDKELYLNGERMPNNMAYFARADGVGDLQPDSILLEPVQNRRLYHGEKTLVDELRFYSRPLTPPEVANAYRRYRPELEVSPLPFAYARVVMNHPLKRVKLLMELLSPEREKVEMASVAVFGPNSAGEIGRTETPEFVDGRCEMTMDNVPVGYGKHRLDVNFLASDGEKVGDMSIERDRVAPPWLGSDVGKHPGQVLPGWEPLEVENDAVMMIGRRIEFGADGWPHKIISQGQNLLAGPMKVSLEMAEETLLPRAAETTVKIEKRADDEVLTEGSASAGNWTVRTRCKIDYDGMMRVRMELTGKATAKLDGLSIEIPVTARDGEYYGYWTGARNFRAACWYGATPKKEGVVFRSDKPRRRKSERIKGSFVPYVTLAGADRGLAWFAENDRGWTKHDDKPSVVVERTDSGVTLRLNIIQETTAIEEDLTLEFGLQPAPVRAPAEDRRSTASRLHFGWVDGFSKQDLKTPGNWGSFNIYPYEYDWDAAARRAELHHFHYGKQDAYTGPYLYVDRNWVGLPPNTWEYRGIWYKSGFFRYYDEAANCYLWNMDQWMKHDLIEGIYIDDAWIGVFKDPERGPAYRLPDGTVQPGFEFFDYHDFMKRLRWVFLDNGQRPRIWVHMTNTHYLPILSFADFILDGEWKFLGWGDKRDFMDMWTMARFRFSNAQSWGLSQVWMNKIGADEDTPVELPHWEYRQRRSYHAMLMSHDIFNVGRRLKDAERAGLYSDDARFVGYWEPSNPVVSASEQYVTSVYKHSDRSILVVVNAAEEDGVAELEIDLAGVLAGERPASLRIKDVDTYDPPRGEDLTMVKNPDTPTMPEEGEEDDMVEGFEDIIAEDQRRERERKERGFLYDNHNFQWESGVLKLRVRGHDYRLIQVQAAGRGDAGRKGRLP